MDTATVISFGDLKDGPRVMKVVPNPLRNGDHIYLQFTVRRKNGGRTEEMVVDGVYRVTQVAFDTRGMNPRQLLTVEAIGVAPSWRSIRTPPSWKRNLPPAKSPRTQVG